MKFTTQTELDDAVESIEMIYNFSENAWARLHDWNARYTFSKTLVTEGLYSHQCAMIEKLLDNSYWERVWILQELILPVRVQLLTIWSTCDLRHLEIVQPLLTDLHDYLDYYSRSTADEQSIGVGVAKIKKCLAGICDEVQPLIRLRGRHHRWHGNSDLKDEADDVLTMLAATKNRFC